jgi:hypothetical protein
LADAKAFSIKRKAVYKSSIPCQTLVRDYANPILRLNKSKVPKFGAVASAVSDYVETKLLVLYRMTSGKTSYGLTSKGMIDSLRYCSRARNPYEAYATGGYEVLTSWVGPARASSEWLWLTNHLINNVEMMYDHTATKVYSGYLNEEGKHIAPEVGEKAHTPSRSRKRDLDIPLSEHASVYKKLSLGQLSVSDQVYLPNQKRDDMVQPSVVNVRTDLLRNVMDVEEEIFSGSEDEIDYLGEYAEVDYSSEDEGSALAGCE